MVRARLTPRVACLLLGLLGGWSLAACTRVMPYHTIAPSDPVATTAPICRPDPDAKEPWTVPEACRSLIAERSPDYDLFFAEFDDQGWPFDAPLYGAAGQQIPIVIDRLSREVAESPRGVSIVTFVHGWKHNAASDDPNVRTFREVLTGLSHLESQTCHRKVVGLYVGWRGSALSVGDPWANVSFWDRKNIAAKVAQGSVRELFARIRSLESTTNGTDGARTRDPCAQHKLRSMYIGHSFGGLILFTVLSEALIKDVADFQGAQRGDDAARRQAVLPREGDLVLIVNPAIEASRFDALARAVERQKPYERYQAPLFVSIASKDDAATREAFPLGRAVGTLFEAYSPGMRSVERAANLKTISQDDRYLTMSLQSLSQYNRAHPEHPLGPSPACADYLQPNGKSKAEVLAIHTKKERENFDLFVKSLGPDRTAGNSFPRHFCGDQEMVLSLRREPLPDGSTRVADPNSPVWNIQTGAPIIKDHGDISNHLMLQFVRQLYLDSEEPALEAAPRR